jgi:hypothetical protein
VKQAYLLPPVQSDDTGQPRRAGFEFEFGNLPILKAARSLQESLGGELVAKNPFEATLEGTELGALKIERDARLLKSVRYRKWLEQLGVEFEPGSIGHGIEENIDTASSIIIPCEVVTQPIAFDRLHLLDDLVVTLGELGAEGTQDSLVYAFGMHINPSLADREADTLRRSLQAFLLLYSWIVESAEIDLTRRYLTKFIDPFPQQYVDRVLREDYRPDLELFTADYLRDNPTRNRALDLLPILRELRPEQVEGSLREDERALVKPRPAFHYRLPDCKVNEPGWSASAAWNQWVYIEKLAADEELLRELMGEWRASNQKFSLAPKTSWTMRLTSILSQKFFER